MKNKLSFISLAAVVGLIGVGFGAWAFGEETTKSQDISIGIEGAVEGSIGTLTFAPIDTYTIKEEALDTISFTATFVVAEGKEALVGAHTYEVAVVPALAAYITVTGDKVFVSGEAELLTVTWVDGMKPETLLEYTALKDVVTALPEAAITISAKVALK